MIILLNEINVNDLLIKLSLILYFPKTFFHASTFTTNPIYDKLKWKS